MTQWFIVAALVAGSALYALWSLLSARLRLQLLDLAGPRLAGTAALTALRRRTLAQLVGGCGSCAANPDAGESGTAKTSMKKPA